MVKYCNRAWKKRFYFCFVFSKYLKNGGNYFVKKHWANPWRFALQKTLMTEHRKNYTLRDINNFVKMSVSTLPNFEALVPCLYEYKKDEYVCLSVCSSILIFFKIKNHIMIIFEYFLGLKGKNILLSSRVRYHCKDLIERISINLIEKNLSPFENCTIGFLKYQKIKYIRYI